MKRSMKLRTAFGYIWMFQVNNTTHFIEVHR